ncbi:MAG: hypothetical protein BWY86_01097 [Candidatus Aminicenantes bacterium ADurb.Bin508]|nr:MAG: hypothetical protein BWY86_01097 [Candidatus Aminicenantes bacterium ADurb.Bin508]
MFFKRDRTRSRIPGFVWLASFPQGPEGEIVKNLLQSEGIPFFAEQEAIGSLCGVSLDGLGTFDLFVPEERKEEVASLLREMSDNREQEPTSGTT